MRISDWSSDVCSADLPRPCADKTPAPKSRLSFMSTEFSAPTTGDVIRASGIGFGTSGARGLVDDLSDEACAAFVLAFVSVAGQRFAFGRIAVGRSEEHTSELQSLMRISYAVFCLKKKNN